jgi:hypothetical protein
MNDPQEGLARAKTDVLLKDKWGFLDKNGNFVIQPTYEDVYPFTEEGLARAKTDTENGAS